MHTNVDNFVWATMKYEKLKLKCFLVTPFLKSYLRFWYFFVWVVFIVLQNKTKNITQSGKSLTKPKIKKSTILNVDYLR